MEKKKEQKNTLRARNKTRQGRVNKGRPVSCSVIWLVTRPVIAAALAYNREPVSLGQPPEIG